MSEQRRAWEAVLGGKATSTDTGIMTAVEVSETETVQEREMTWTIKRRERKREKRGFEKSKF